MQVFAIKLDLIESFNNLCFYYWQRLPEGKHNSVLNSSSFAWLMHNTADSNSCIRKMQAEM